MNSIRKYSSSSILSLVMTGCVTASSLAQEASQPWTANPATVKKWSGNRNFSGFIFDESKVPNYSLPNPLLKNDGSRVVNELEWTNSRRAELMELFRSQMYGRRPKDSYSLSFQQTAVINNAFNGKATGRAMKANIQVGERVFSFPFVIFIPNNVDEPVPAVVHINWVVSLQNAVAEQDPKWPAWPVEMLIDRDYATAAFSLNDVDPDQKDGYANGIRAFFANGARPSDDAWGSLSAWGWGASRILDYVETIDAIDVKRVAISGHSRLGTTALWAACEDVRFAVAYGNNSGCTGAALTRRKFGENLEAITRNFPHHYCKTLPSYADRESELPVDQHELIGLISPRAVYVASAGDDLWADPTGEYLSLVAAAPVFRLFGQQTINDPIMPPLDHPKIRGVVGYHIRDGRHNLTVTDWNWFLDFADTILK